MRVRIVSYEDINAWILGKFARRLREELIRLNIEVDIQDQADPAADINHHIIYLGYDTGKATGRDTLMITHIDDIRKLDLLKRQMKFAKAGICMSRSVMNELVSAGIAAAKMAFINPAHDGVIKPRKLVIGITSKVQPDGCKREQLVEHLFNHISPEIFSLSIMGGGWDRIVGRIRKKGFAVDYVDDFNYDRYASLVPSFDYYLYTGMDEGSMGFIDALAAGVKTVVTAQGYHLDAPGGMVYPFTEEEELISIFQKIEKEKKALMDSVATWNWKDYAIKHVELWKYLIDGGAPQSIFNDGVNSLIGEKDLLDKEQVARMETAMRKGTFKRTISKIKKFRDPDFAKGIIRKFFGNKKK